MNEPTCKACTHFRQHYGKRGIYYVSINCGHCVYPRIKVRKPNTPACDKFAPKSLPAENTPQM